MDRQARAVQTHDPASGVSAMMMLLLLLGGHINKDRLLSIPIFFFLYKR